MLSWDKNEIDKLEKLKELLSLSDIELVKRAKKEKIAMLHSISSSNSFSGRSSLINQIQDAMEYIAPFLLSNEAYVKDCALSCVEGRKLNL